MKSNIRKLRSERNMSQTDLAEIIGKTQQTVSHMERDRDRIPIESLITMSEYFGVSTDYILGLEEEKTEPEENDKETVPTEDEFVKKETENIRTIAQTGNSKMMYQLILSILLCSLEEQAKAL